MITVATKHLWPQNAQQSFFSMDTFGSRFRKAAFVFLELEPFSTHQSVYSLMKDSETSSVVSFEFIEREETYFQSIKISGPVWPVIVVYLKRRQLEKETVMGQNQINDIHKTPKSMEVDRRSCSHV